VANSALLSIALALIGIGLYVALRFEWGFGIGAVVATVHDGLMTVGAFVFLGEFMGIGSGQFTAPMIASILMVLGYSINDTIVVFDRIREEMQLNPGASLRDIIHLSINRTLSRTMLTSLTTFLATAALYVFAAGVIVDFALVFLIGIITGTFSSIFIASRPSTGTTRVTVARSRSTRCCRPTSGTPGKPPTRTFDPQDRALDPYNGPPRTCGAPGEGPGREPAHGLPAPQAWRERGRGRAVPASRPALAGRPLCRDAHGGGCRARARGHRRLAGYPHLR
jgi:hypothetical protein